MNKAVENLERQLVGIRSGTISVGLIDTIKVPYNGQMTPISHLAYATPIKGGISITPHEPSMVHSVEKALKASQIHAYVFSRTTVMASIPPISGEEKERVRTYIRSLGEEAKIAVRNVRKHCKQTFGGCKEDQRKFDKDLQQITDAATQEIDAIVSSKALHL